MPSSEGNAAMQAIESRRRADNHFAVKRVDTLKLDAEHSCECVSYAFRRAFATDHPNPYKLSHPCLNSGKMLTTKCDRRGRLYLKEAVRSRYGERFVIVERPDALLLIPVPADSIADLRSLGQPLRGIPLYEIKARIRERARQEASA